MGDRRRAWKLAGAGVVLAGSTWMAGCAAMTNKAPEPIKKLNLPPLIKDPAWIKGDCQSELRRKGVFGVCAVVPVARDGKPLPPSEVADKALGQAAEQMVETVRQLILRAVSACERNCGNLPDGPPRLEIAGRIASAAVKLAKVNQHWLAADNVLYALVALDLGSLVDSVNKQGDLDDVARQEITGRMREDLTR